MRMSDWSSDVCASDLRHGGRPGRGDGSDRSSGPRGGHARRLAGAGVLAALPAVEAAALAGGADHDGCGNTRCQGRPFRSEEHTSELQSLMRISSAVFCLKKKLSYAIHPQPHTAAYIIRKMDT